MSGRVKRGGRAPCDVDGTNPPLYQPSLSGTLHVPKAAMLLIVNNDNTAKLCLGWCRILLIFLERSVGNLDSVTFSRFFTVDANLIRRLCSMQLARVSLSSFNSDLWRVSNGN